MNGEQRAFSRGNSQSEADLRAMLEERTRQQEETRKGRARIVRWLGLGFVLAAVVVVASSGELRSAVAELLKPRPASPAVPAGEPAPGAEPARKQGVDHGLDTGDVRFAEEVIRFLQPGGAQQAEKDGSSNK